MERTVRTAMDPSLGISWTPPCLDRSKIVSRETDTLQRMEASIQMRYSALSIRAWGNTDRFLNRVARDLIRRNFQNSKTFRISAAFLYNIKQHSLLQSSSICNPMKNEMSECKMKGEEDVPKICSLFLLFQDI